MFDRCEITRVAVLLSLWLTLVQPAMSTMEEPSPSIASDFTESDFTTIMDSSIIMIFNDFSVDIVPSASPSYNVPYSSPPTTTITYSSYNNPSPSSTSTSTRQYPPHSSTTTSSTLTVLSESLTPSPTEEPTSNPSSPPPAKMPPPRPRCPEQRDRCFGINWPRSPPFARVTRPCPRTFIGRATRKCRRDGTWLPVNITQCIATTIEGVDEVSNDMFDMNTCDEDEMTKDSIFLIRQLRNLTRPPPRRFRRPFLNRDNLRSVNSLSRKSLRFLRRQRLNQTVQTSDISEVFELFNNALDSRNRDSWEELQESESGSEELLSNAEEYASITASLLQEAGDVFRFTDENLALRAERIHSYDILDTVFPSIADLSNTSIDVNSIRIPSGYVRSSMSGSSDQEDVLISFLLFPTLQDFLPYDSNTEENSTMVGSVILSAQVEYSNGSIVNKPPGDIVLDVANMIELNFTVNVIEQGPGLAGVSSGDNVSFTCVYWNFTDNFNSTSSGNWLSDGIVTEIIDNNTVRCLSSHLTSFAVLVDVSGTLTQLHDDNPSNDTNSTSLLPAQLKALSYVSYIGTGLSVVCLVLTILYLLTYGKELITRVHNFLHLNLAVSLLLGLIVFIAGIQNATVNFVSCKIVAILLHYFFLSAFCWMLCEAILLYLLIVIVFTSPANYWYLFVLFGYGVPAVIVGASFAAFRNEYIGSTLCWLSYSSYAIWTFVAPMCLIVLLNTIVLVLVTIQFSQVKRKMRKLSVLGEKSRFRRLKERRQTVSDLLKGIFFLLPLLGITWIVGLFALNANTLFFAWLFTILNSLQGVFIFVFHVLCSERSTSFLKKKFMKNAYRSDLAQPTNSTMATPMSVRKGNYTLGKSDKDSLDKLSSV